MTANDPRIWSDFHQEAPIRQGDVIKNITKRGNIPNIGVVINADCDLEQGKNAKTVNYLKILSVQEYSDQYWAPKQLERLIAKRTNQTIEILNGIIKRSHPKLNSLEPSDLYDWLRTEGLDAMFSSLEFDSKRLKQTQISSMRALEVAVSDEKYSSPVAQLKASFKMDLRKPEDLSASLQEELSSPKGFPDYIFLPEIPNVDGIGFVVMLREIFGIQQQEVFSSEFLGKISNNDGHYYRVARLSDVFRYSIAQKLSFLFSRIGIPVELENQQKEAAAIAANEVLDLERIDGQSICN